MRAAPALATFLLLPLIGGCHTLHELGGIAGQYSSNAPLLTGPIKSETRPVGTFTKVQAGGALEVDIQQGSAPKCVIETAAPVLAHIKSSVRGDTLVLETVGNFRNDKPMKAHITTASLSGVTLSGASSVKSPATWTSGDFSVNFSGASQGKLNVKTGRVSADLSGASQIDLVGSASDLKLNSSGASHFRGDQLPLRSVQVQASGASQVKVVASESISGQISGATHLQYRGKAKMKVSSSGVSSIESF